MEYHAYKEKLWKKVLCVILSLIMGLGTFVSITFGNILLSDYVDLKTAFAAEISNNVPVFYRYGELVGLYKVNYTDTTKIQYKIGENGEWTDYAVPFSIPAFQTTKVYARIGNEGQIIYENFSTTEKAIGVYEEHNTDFYLSYNNIRFDYIRSYNSADEKWYDSIDSNVIVSNNLATVMLPDGNTYKLVQNDDNSFIDELNGFVLKKINGNYIFYFENLDYYFTSNYYENYLIKIIDDSNNFLELNRNATLCDFTISDQVGRSFSIEESFVLGEEIYCIREITDPNGNKLNYKLSSDRTNYYSAVDQAGVYIGDYQYNNEKLTKSDDKTIEYYSNGRLKKITYDNGSWIQYTYSDDEKTYTTLTSSGKTTKTVYNDAFYPVEYTDESGEETTYTYDNHYRVLTESCDTSTITYNYDSNGNIISYVTDKTENNTYYTYDSNKRVVREQVGDEYTYYTYDSNGNKLVYATLKENYTGEAPTLYDPSLSCFDTTTYTYDDKGRVLSEVYSLGGSVSYEYDNMGNITKETTVIVENGESKTTVVNNTYDSFGNLLTSSRGDNTSSYIYDDAGRTLFANENGKCTRILYDNLGRVIQKIDPEDYDSTKDGLPTQNTYSDKNVGHRYVYNETTGNLDQEINRFGVVSNYEYYSTGEKKKETFDIYEYDYNIKGNLTDVFIDGVNTLTYNYDENYNLTSEVYANGQSIRYEYDDNNNLIKQYHNNDISPYVTYSYDSYNELVQKVNTDTGLKTIYDENNNVNVYKLSDNTIVQSYTKDVIETDEENDIEYKAEVVESHFGTTYSSVIKDDSVSYTLGDDTVEYSYTKDDESISLDAVKFNNNTVISSTYENDSNNDITSKTLSYNGNTSVKNTYDDSRISSTGYRSPKIYYTYDENGQIVRSDNGVLNYISTFTYDNRGNILTKSKYNYTRNGSLSENPTETTTFTYSNDGWSDKLSSVNGLSLTYDAIGNVLTYGSKTFTWTSGRNLSHITDGSNTYSYTYDESGIRTSKTVNNVTTYYNTKDGVILSQTDGTNTMYFQYDTSGIPLGMIWNNTQYLYLTNQMGDVISITDVQGNELVQYEYDEWGAVASVLTTHNSQMENTLADINPLRYRGYYFDSETGYYYLQSRYYDPSICRFINSDSPDVAQVQRNYFGGINIFSYCLNDPINLLDAGGNISVSKKKQEEIINRYKKAMASYIKSYSLNSAQNIKYTVTKDKYELYTVSCEYRMPRSNNKTIYYNCTYLYGTTSAWQGNYDSLVKTANISEAFMQGFMDIGDSLIIVLLIIILVIFFAGLLTTSDNEAKFYEQCLKNSRKSGDYGIIQTFSKITYSGTNQSVKYIVRH